MNYAELASQFAQEFKKSIPVPLEAEAKAASPTAATLLGTVIDALPYYQQGEVMNAHRAAIINILETSLPNNAIEPQPNSGDWDSNTSYTYYGNYTGYQNAFYNGIGKSAGAAAVLTTIARLVPSANINWQAFAVAVLTDAVRLQNAASINTGSLASSLNTCNTQFDAVLSASYLAIISQVYGPNTSALNAIPAGSKPAVFGLFSLTMLNSDNIITNLAIALANPETAVAAAWFIYNLCIAMKSLDAGDVDQVLDNIKLTLPPQISAGQWWSGGYASWFPPLSGSDVQNAASGTVTATMPEQSLTYTANTGGQPEYGYTNVPNGYSQSLCNWGPLNSFNPPPASCFGKGTMVLMADGSSKPIETIKPGDPVFTQHGSRKVVIIETPARQGRQLFSLNGFALAVTISHPFISGESGVGKYSTLDPWGLIDGIPTSTAMGVTLLKAGTKLLGFGAGSQKPIEIEELREVQQLADDECVYDLVLENWERDSPYYFVGGPVYFLATEAETVNPRSEPLVSAAIVTALTLATDTSRQHIAFPETSLPRILRYVDLHELRSAARNSKIKLNTESSLPAIPKPDFYYQGASWDPHASLLEYYLVRYYGRWLRTEIINGWRTTDIDPAGDCVVLDLNDIEIQGQPISATGSLELRLQVQNADGTTGAAFNHQLPVSGKPCWRILIDDSLMLDIEPGTTKEFLLAGSLFSDTLPVADFRMSVSRCAQNTSGSDILLYDQARRITGRINIGIRFQKRECFEKDRAARRDFPGAGRMSFYALSLGRQLAMQVNGIIKSKSFKKSIV